MSTNPQPPNSELRTPNSNGKFIVFYGINNLGKSTQAKLLVQKMQEENFPVEYIKYPIYSLEPSGTLINQYLREGNPNQLSPRELQILTVLNRTQSEPILKEKLASGINIISEDYTGSGLAWGIGGGVSANFLKKINEHLLKEDLAFVFDGQRFTEATEAGHTHETNEKLLTTARLAYSKLGDELGWVKINANLPITDIQTKIWLQVEKIL